MNNNQRLRNNLVNDLHIAFGRYPNISAQEWFEVCNLIAGAFFDETEIAEAKQQFLGVELDKFFDAFNKRLNENITT